MIVETYTCTAAATEQSDDTQARVQGSSTSAATQENGDVSHHLDTVLMNVTSKSSKNSWTVEPASRAASTRLVNIIM